MEAYKHIQRLSGERWAQLKSVQMKIPLQSGRSDVIANVYLHEQQRNEAIAIAERNAYDYTLREKVADAVIAHRPKWSSAFPLRKLKTHRTCPKQILSVRWLAKAKQAYLRAGRKVKWQDFFTHLKITYARRYRKN
jgi:hypothetical protein